MANPRHISYPILTEKQIKGYDLVVCCADNLDVRRLLYRSNVEWLDTNGPEQLLENVVE